MSVHPGLPADPRCFCVTDVGSTTTKARFFLREREAWRIYHAESPTTVEHPHADVTVGVQRALEALEPQTGCTLWSDGRPAIPYLSTSSAGGGLAMVVTGLVASITSRSAERVALGAGAIVLDVLAMDDGRTPYGKVQALEALRPDIVLLAGGFDGDNFSGPVFLAELLNEAALRPKLNAAARLPVIYAGNAQAAPFVMDTLSKNFAVTVVDNLRPGPDRERLGPAHDAIHHTFMEHVMSQAPGYPTLLDWVAAPVLPTPSAFGSMLALASRTQRQRILAIDIGGATTDVFTAEHGVVQRTVSANLGMSYSILHVLRRVGVEAVCALLDPPIETREVVDRVGGKLLHPTRLPAGDADARVERAVAALAIREAVRDHLRVLRGTSLDRSSDELQIRSVMDGGAKTNASGSAAASRPPLKPESLRGYAMVIGSGGILSHAEPGVAARILVDGLQPEGRIELAVDRGFVIPHLGALAEVRPDLALELYQSVALERLGTAREGRKASSTSGGASSAGPTPAAGRGRDHGGGSREAPRSQLGAADLSDPGPGVIAVDTAGDAESDSRFGRAPAELRFTMIRIRRELNIPGDVRVGEGQIVQSGTVVARCTRLFPRPFFLKPAATLQCAPEETASFLLKRQGDLVEAGTLLARRKTGPFSTKEFHSTVTGTIERILPDGTVVVRERPEFAREVWLVDLARELDLPAKRLLPYLRCQVGQEVEKGQWLAAQTGHGAPRVVSSPGRGRIESIDLDRGTVRIQPLLEELQVNAWLPGSVVERTPRGAVIEGPGLELSGVWGTGQETAGPLVFGDSPAAGSSSAGAARGTNGAAAGTIVVHDGQVTRALLEGWAGQGAAGAIAAGAGLSEFLDWSPPFPLVLVEGFGAGALSPGMRALLAAHSGGWTLLDGTTEIRVGLRRPRIILCPATRDGGSFTGGGPDRAKLRVPG